jgi:hypothetical protein
MSRWPRNLADADKARIASSLNRAVGALSASFSHM